MSPRLRGDIELQLANMMEVLEQTSSERHALLGLSPGDVPNAWDRRAAAGVLHEWYGGVENILKRACKIVDLRLPDGDRSHKELLDQAARPTHARPAMFSEAMHLRLREYLEFRHVARHRYSIELDWVRQRPLLEKLPQDHEAFAREIRGFLDVVGAP